MVHSTLYTIFKQGSKTYFYSSLFFPMDIRSDVFILYSFVRTADDFVDILPQHVDAFYAFKERYESALHGKMTGDIVIDGFIDLMKRKRFESAWISAFLDAMEMDIKKSTYATIEELKEYMYGSAEVVGLMMSRIMDLPPQSYECACHLGRAMQYINFIRDIRDDLQLGRVYLPQDDMKQCGLASLEYNYVKNHKEQFSNFIHAQIARFEDWQGQAEKGFMYIPKRYFIPIRTASEMYKWTAHQIKKRPLVVYEKKVKPSITSIVMQFLYSTARYH